MKEYVNLLKEQGLPIPPKNQNPKIIIQNKDVLPESCNKLIANEYVALFSAVESLYSVTMCLICVYRRLSVAYCII
jgi:hypothetical protein